MLASVLWNMLSERQVQDLRTDGTAGHQFEDLTVQAVYKACAKLGRMRTFAPRYTLRLPTVSGLQHQIDVVVSEGPSIYHLIECKFAKSVTIDQLYATNAKLLDYSFGATTREQKTEFRGYFLVSPSKVNDNFYRYASTWGITLVAAGGLPPPEYMIEKIPPHTDAALFEQLVSLSEKTTGGNFTDLLTKPRNAEKLLMEWRACYQKWKRKGYGI